MSELTKEKKFALWAFIALLIIGTILVLQPFLISLTMGFVFAIAMTPTQYYLIKRFKLKQITASILTSILFLLVIFVPVIAAIYKILNYLAQNTQMFSETGPTQQNLFSFITLANDKLGLSLDTQSIRNVFHHSITVIQQYTMTLAKDFAAALPEVLMQLTIMMLTVVFILLNHKKMTYKMLSIKGVSHHRVSQIYWILADVSKDVVFSNVITGLIQATLVTVGVAATTDFNLVFTFIITFVVSFIPVIGAAPVLVVVAVYLLIRESYAAAVGLIVLSGIVGVSDNIIRAWLMTKKQDDNSFLNLLASIGGIYLLGVAGVFMGPLIVSLTIKLIPLLFEEVHRNYYEVGTPHPNTWPPEEPPPEAFNFFDKIH